MDNETFESKNEYPQYDSIYYEIRFMEGKELHKEVTKNLRAARYKKKKLEADSTSESEKEIQKLNEEIEALKLLQPYKFEDKDIHPQYDVIKTYISKTKTTTNVATRKIFNQATFTEHLNAYSKKEVTMLKQVFKEHLTDEIIKECIELAEAEKNRILTYQKEGKKRARIGKEINRELARICPGLIEEMSNKNNFFSKLKFKRNNIGFFLTREVGKDAEIINEYLEQIMATTKPVKIDLDEHNENYFVLSNRNNELAFLGSIVTENLKLFGIPVTDIINSCLHKGVKLSDIDAYDVNFNEYYNSIRFLPGMISNVYAMNRKVYSEESVRYVIDKLMELYKFESEVYLAAYLHCNYLWPISNYAQKRKTYFEKNNIEMPQNRVKDKKEQIYKQMIVDGKANVKWKNETHLFKLVSKYYPDAIYQYRADWLGRQSLDVYIPSIKTGIEYQGQQHYEPVEFFGGKEALLYRQKLDADKLKRCQENGVRLIQWHYKDNISKTNLDRNLT